METTNNNTKERTYKTYINKTNKHTKQNNKKQNT